MTVDTSEINEEFRSKIYFQKYPPKKIIDGVKLINIQNHIDEESDFSEIIKLNKDGSLELIPSFNLKQINRTKLQPNSIKAWHIHLKQNELWYVLPQYTLLVGLWDLRKNSPTKGYTMRMVLGGGVSNILFIPKGVAHGSANLTLSPIDMFYFVDETFNAKNPDEGRLHWDELGEDFWKPVRD